jgi:hypothetical protein
MEIIFWLGVCLKTSLFHLHFKNIVSGAGGVAKVVDCLPSKCKTLSSNPAPPNIIF